MEQTTDDQAAYGRFIRHSARCSECRQTGMDCEDAAELREMWRDAQRQVTA